MVLVGDATGAQGGGERVALVTGHDAVLDALEESDRVDDVAGVEDGRALAVAVGGLGEGTDERIEVAGLELVGVAGEREQVGNAVVADTSAVEARMHLERAQDGVAARAATENGKPVAIGEATGGHGLGAGAAVLDIGDTPRPAQGEHRLAPGAAATAVVHRQHRVPTASEELDLRPPARINVVGGAAVYEHDERRWAFIEEALARGRVVQTVDLAAGGVRPRDGPGEG